MVSRKRQVLNVLQDSEVGKEEKGGRNSEKEKKKKTKQHELRSQNKPVKDQEPKW